MRDQGTQGIAHRLRIPHQATDQPKGFDCSALADQKPEIRAGCAGGAQGEQPAQGRMRECVRFIIEPPRIECRPTDKRVGIDAELAQGRDNFLSDPLVKRTGLAGSVQFYLPGLFRSGRERGGMH